MTWTEDRYGKYHRSEKFRKTNKKWRDNRQQERTEFITEHLGDSCAVCDSKDYLIVHRTDHVSHVDSKDMGQEKFIQHITDGKAVRLCRFCHKSAHWCADHLGLEWEKVTELIRRNARVVRGPA